MRKALSSLYRFGFLLRLLCLVIAAGCVPARSIAPPAVPRADPGYSNWLERQSVLGMAPELAAIVSGSSLAWRQTARNTEPDSGPDSEPGAKNTKQDASAVSVAPLLRQADVWLHVDGRALSTREKTSVLAELSRTGLVRDLAVRGVRGLFLAPAHPGGAFWNDSRPSGRPGADAVSLRFAEQMGTDAEFNRLRDEAAASSMLLGGDLLPAAPGKGPDFLLAGTAAREYPGAWIMMEAPRAAWPELPSGGQALTAEQADKLAKAGILPGSLNRDALPGDWGLPRGGWAATGEILGIDGALRRWLYRYDADPGRPVLNWDDPSAAARRMLSSSVIREVGVLRNPLAGLHLTPLFGLERPAAESPDGLPATRAPLEPGLSALRALSREIGRYGGYSLEREALPLIPAALLLERGADFVVDPATFPFAEYALLTGDAAPLRRAFDAALAARLPQNRLMRPLSRVEGIPPALLSGQDRTAFEERMRATGWTSVFQPAPSSPVYATVPALAAMRLGLSPQDVERAAVASSAQRETETISELHELLFAFRAGLPGMVWIAGQDMAGVTHNTIAHEDGKALPLWSPDPGLAGRAGSGVSLYARPGSAPLFPDRLAAITALRRELDVADGRCLARVKTTHPGGVAVLSRLPSGGALMVAANFSDQDVTERLDVPGAKDLKVIMGTGHCEYRDGALFLTLPARSWVWLRGYLAHSGAGGGV